jgi:hypothetical protein
MSSAQFIPPRISSGPLSGREFQGRVLVRCINAEAARAAVKAQNRAAATANRNIVEACDTSRQPMNGETGDRIQTHSLSR